MTAVGSVSPLAASVQIPAAQAAAAALPAAPSSTIASLAVPLTFETAQARLREMENEIVAGRREILREARSIESRIDFSIPAHAQLESLVARVIALATPRQDVIRRREKGCFGLIGRVAIAYVKVIFSSLLAVFNFWKTLFGSLLTCCGWGYRSLRSPFLNVEASRNRLNQLEQEYLTRRQRFQTELEQIGNSYLRHEPQIMERLGRVVRINLA